jgi:hypothetical protein
MPKSVCGFRATSRSNFLIERRIQISGRLDLKSSGSRNTRPFVAGTGARRDRIWSRTVEQSTAPQPHIVDIATAASILEHAELSWSSGMPKAARAR